MESSDQIVISVFLVRFFLLFLIDGLGSVAVGAKNRLRSDSDAPKFAPFSLSLGSLQSLRRFEGVDSATAPPALVILFGALFAKRDSGPEEGVETLGLRDGGTTGAEIDSHVDPLACRRSVVCVDKGVKLLGSNSASGVLFGLKKESMCLMAFVSGYVLTALLRGLSPGVHGAVQIVCST